MKVLCLGELVWVILFFFGWNISRGFFFGMCFSGFILLEVLFVIYIGKVCLCGYGR